MRRISLLVAPSFAALALFGPQYDPDLFYYTSGALNWEPGRPPLYTVFLSVCRRIWPSPYLPALLQIALWALAARALLNAVFFDERSKNVAAWILAWEPVGMYYRASLLSEGLFESALMFQAALYLRQRHVWAGVAGGLALLTRYTAVFCAPLWLWAAFSPRARCSTLAQKEIFAVAKRPGYLSDNRYYALFGPYLALMIIVVGHQMSSGGITGPGAFLAYHARTPVPECPVGDDLPRQEAVRRQALCLTEKFSAWPPSVAKVKADSVLLQRSLTLSAVDWALVYLRHVGENLLAAVVRNRLDYRNDEIAFLEQDYRELDELAFRLYGLTRNVPVFWEKAAVWNVYMTLFFLMLVLTAGMRWKKRMNGRVFLILSAVLPMILLLLGPVPYKTRFVAPWLGLSAVWTIAAWTHKPHNLTQTGYG